MNKNNSLNFQVFVQASRDVGRPIVERFVDGFDTDVDRGRGGSDRHRDDDVFR